MNSPVPVRYFQLATYQLAYRVLGSGPAVLLAFHGFGQDGEVFMPLQSTVGHRYTIYAIDLFFHGESRYPDDQILTKIAWQSLIDAFLQAHTIDRFSLIGFSLGGRFALIIAEHYAQQLEQLILIAPDGITRNYWYRLATRTPQGRWLFKLVVQNLSVLSRIGQLLINIRLLDRTVMRFAEVSLATPEQRQQVYLSWTRFRSLYADLSVLSDILNSQPVRIRFFTGFFDKIVPGSYIRPLTSRLHSYELTVLKAGHNKLIERVASLL